jgi:hypothetical protein
MTTHDMNGDRNTGSTSIRLCSALTEVSLKLVWLDFKSAVDPRL